MVKHAQTNRRLLLTNCLSVFDSFVGLARKGLTVFFSHKGTPKNPYFILLD